MKLPSMRKLHFTRMLLCAFLLVSIAICPILLQESAFAESKDIPYYFGKAVFCEKDKGFIPDKEKPTISKKNLQWGWKLGQFYIKGFSDKSSKEKDVYLKTVGDEIEFGFKLEQDIDALNGDSDLTISHDKKMYIEDPAYEKSDLGRGTLIVEKTDYQGKVTVTPYKDFLTGVSVDANTKVELFEEGDYRVVLVYEIQKKSGPFGAIKNYENYRIDSSFKIRNGNSMVFLKDATTTGEQTNGSQTENGFTIDLAQSHYLHVTVRKAILNDTKNGLVEDTRFNSPASDGKSYTDPGKYTITVSNDYTDGNTETVIYVGEDSNLLKETDVASSDVSYNEIDDPSEVSNDDFQNTKIDPKPVNNDGEQNSKVPWHIIAIAVLAAVVFIIAVVGVAKRKNKHTEEKEL